jgi:hypothetical protein
MNGAKNFSSSINDVFILVYYFLSSIVSDARANQVSHNVLRRMRNEVELKRKV